MSTKQDRAATKKKQSEKGSFQREKSKFKMTAEKKPQWVWEIKWTLLNTKAVSWKIILKNITETDNICRVRTSMQDEFRKQLTKTTGGQGGGQSMKKVSPSWPDQHPGGWTANEPAIRKQITQTLCTPKGALQDARTMHFRNWRCSFSWFSSNRTEPRMRTPCFCSWL